MWQTENLWRRKEKYGYISFLNCLHSKITHSLLRYQRSEWVCGHGCISMLAFEYVTCSYFTTSEFLWMTSLSVQGKLSVHGRQICLSKASSQFMTICKFLMSVQKDLLVTSWGTQQMMVFTGGIKKRGGYPGVSLSPVYRNLIMKQPLRMQSYLHC